MSQTLSHSFAPQTLAGALLGGAMGSLARKAALVVAGSLLLTLSAKTQVPMFPVPMTMQSFMVIFLGAAFGPALGAAAVIAYLVQGFAGLPVFAGPVAGPAYLTGPTAGFLFSFIPAAMLAGLAARAGAGLLRVGAGMLAAHALIMLAGFVWLAFFAQLATGGTGVGAAAAWAKGVEPFLLGMLVKVALATALVAAGWTLVQRRG